MKALLFIIRSNEDVLSSSGCPESNLNRKLRLICSLCVLFCALTSSKNVYHGLRWILTTHVRTCIRVKELSTAHKSWPLLCFLVAQVFRDSPFLQGIQVYTAGQRIFLFVNGDAELSPDSTIQITNNSPMQQLPVPVSQSQAVPDHSQQPPAQPANQQSRHRVIASEQLDNQSIEQTIRWRPAYICIYRVYIYIYI